jgi:hypothetical protein
LKRSHHHTNEGLSRVAYRVFWDVPKLPEAGQKMELYLLSWLIRNLFELTFITEFVGAEIREHSPPALHFYVDLRQSIQSATNKASGSTSSSSGFRSAISVIAYGPSLD